VSEIVLLVRAEGDVLRLYAECESFGEGRGERFTREVEGLLALLLRWPRLGRPVGRNYRRLKMSRLPYALIYSVEGRRVMIQTVVANHESLDAILRRLQR
jgi:plasmid stabilization system protein ParE